MALFEINWKSSSESDLRKIDKQYIPRIVDAIESLANNPFPSQSKKLKDSESGFRLRIGDYRIIYQVDSEKKEIIIYHLRHRKDAYRR
jgi:mRNA interferase RelE/StbE